MKCVVMAMLLSSSGQYVDTQVAGPFYDNPQTCNRAYFQFMETAPEDAINIRPVPNHSFVDVTLSQGGLRTEEPALRIHKIEEIIQRVK